MSKKIINLEKYIDDKININKFNNNINNIISSRNELMRENINIHNKDDSNINNKQTKNVNLKNYNNILKIRESEYNESNKNVITFSMDIVNKYFNKEYKLIQQKWFIKNNETYILLVPNTIDSKFNGWNNSQTFFKTLLNNIDKKLNTLFDLNTLNISSINIYTLLKNKIINKNIFNKYLIYEENAINDERYIEYIKDFKNLSVRYLYLKVLNTNKDNYIIFKINLDNNFIELKEIVINIDDNIINNINKYYK